MSIEIAVQDGELREGSSLDLFVDFTSDVTAHLHTDQYWLVFAEKNVKYDLYQDRYYYETDDDGEIFESFNSSDIQITKLVPGRLFCMFQYVDAYGTFHRLQKVFTVYPKYSISIPSDVIEGDSASFNLTLPSVTSSVITWEFGDTFEVLTGSTVTRDCNVEGYFPVGISGDYSNAVHDNGQTIVWGSTPVDQVYIPGAVAYGLWGNGTRVSTPISETFSENLLVKYDLTKSLNLAVQYGSNFTEEREAPLKLLIEDTSTYGELTFESSPHRLEYVIINFADGSIYKSTSTGFSFDKTYYNSGDYSAVYEVHTLHELSGGPTYRQQLDYSFSITVNPFFTRWIKEHLQTGTIFRTDGFLDLASAWGLQMDRLYNEAKDLHANLNVENLDNRFLSSFFKTYGDYEEIGQKVGFNSFTAESDDKFSFLKDYNFFDRIQNDEVTTLEKQEFINYVQSTRERLRLKGTPAALENMIKLFNLLAWVVELWETDFDQPAPLIDEVFSGSDVIPRTGLAYKNASTPSSDNMNQVVINDKNTSYIEIDTIQQKKVGYYTNDNEVRLINGTEYVVFS